MDFVVFMRVCGMVSPTPVDLRINTGFQRKKVAQTRINRVDLLAHY